jgi:hypothetical protein
MHANRHLSPHETQRRAAEGGVETIVDTYFQRRAVDLRTRFTNDFCGLVPGQRIQFSRWTMMNNI